MQAKSFASLIRYEALVTDRIVMLKDGCLLSGIRYTGMDLDSVPPYGKASIANIANNAVKKLGGGFMLHFEVVRVPSSDYPNGYFSETVTKIMDEERRLQFQQYGQHYETETYIFLTYEPPAAEKSSALRKTISFFTGIGSNDSEIISDTWINTFSSTFNDLVNSLSNIFRIDILEREELLSSLNLCVSGRHTFFIPEDVDSLDTLFTRDLMVGDPLIFDDKYLGIISVDGFPQKSVPTVLDALTRLRGEYRWSTRYIPIGFREAHSIISKTHSKWMQKAIPLMAQILNKPTSKMDKDAITQANDANDALQNLNEGLVAFGHYTGVIIIRCESITELNKSINTIKRAMDELFFTSRIETRNALEAFIGSLPGHGYENVRKPIVHTLNLVHLISLGSMWAGLTSNPCPFYKKFYEARPELGIDANNIPPLLQASTIGENPFRLHLHVSDIGHTLILGPTGSGKSTLIGTVVAQFDRFSGSQIFVFDKGKSIYPLISAMKDASYYELGGDDAPSLCPLACLDTKSDITWAMEFVEVLVQLNGGTMTPERRRIIEQALYTMQKGTTDTSERSLGSLFINVQDEHLKDTLETYTSNGTYGQYLDGEETSIKYSKTTAFELEELLRNGEKVTTPTLLYLFHEIEKRIDGRPTLIVIDEAWLALGTPLFAAKLREWLKVLRKANAAVVLATQSITDITNSDISSVVFSECQTKILLPNAQAKSDALHELYARQLHMNEVEIETVANAIPKRDYFYMSPNGRRLFRLNLGDVALAFIGSGGKDDLKHVQELKERYGDKWPEKWLRDRNLDDWADYWLKLENMKNIEGDKR